MDNDPRYDTSVWSSDECRQRIEAYRGVVHRHLPVAGLKSKRIVLWDIAILSRIAKEQLARWSVGNFTLGRVRLARLTRIIRMCDAGLITKSQYGAYHFHDEPKIRPAIQLKVNVNLTDGIRLSNISKPASQTGMPDFSTIFKGK